MNERWIWKAKRFTINSIRGPRINDYTREIIANPEKCAALELCRPGSLKQSQRGTEYKEIARELASEGVLTGGEAAILRACFGIHL